MYSHGGAHSLTIAPFIVTHTQGRALIDRTPDTFSYVLDYLRSGGTLPPLPKGDEQLLRRIRAEFDYFCFLPNPVDETRTWAEKLRDHAYTSKLVQMDNPLSAEFHSYEHCSDTQDDVFTEGCDFGALVARLNTVGHRSEVWGFALNDERDPRAYNVFSSDRSVSRLSLYDYDLCFGSEHGVVKVVDIRKDFRSGNVLQTFSHGAHDFCTTRISRTHVAATITGSRGVVVWDRSSGRCVREIRDPFCSIEYLWGSIGVLAVEHDEVDYHERYLSCDFSVEGSEPVQICEAHQDFDTVRCVGDTLLLFFSDPDGSGESASSCVVYSIRTGEELRKIVLTSDAPHNNVWDGSCVDDHVFVWADTKEFQDIRCLDVRTGEVSSVHIGLSELACGVHFARDGSRVVAVRKRDNRIAEYAGEYAVYELD